MMTHPKYGVIN